MMSLQSFAEHAKSRLDKLFHTYLVATDVPALRLQKAATYVMLAGGKRLRPLLVYLTGQAFGAPWELLDSPACAIELIHAYSLIHDDLPAMDNSDWRRNQPTCHKAFDEATAILVGDALQPLAFEILVKHPCGLTSQQRLDMVRIVSQNSGITGMAAGQMLDIEGAYTLDALQQMYQLKTGALLTASVQLGAIAAEIKDVAIHQSLQLFAESIGLAFQIQDDLLDVQGIQQDIGKPQGLDDLNQKTTYPALMGVEQSQRKVAELFEQASAAIDFLEKKGETLNAFIELLKKRHY